MDPTGPVVAVRVLGPVELRTGSGLWTEPSALAKRLLVALALAGPRGRSADRLIDDVWGDAPPGKPRGALQMLVSRVRDLGEEGALVSTPTGYAIPAADLAAAEASGAAQPAQPEALPRLTATLALWRGEPGADIDAPELADELRARAERARDRLLAAHLDAAEAAGDARAALHDVELLLASRPLDPALVGRRMRLLERCGRATEAIAAFAEHRQLLADQLGLDPEPALVEQHAALLRRSGGGRAELVGVRAAPTPLIGRDEELARLAELVRANRLTTVLGPGGLGKTRLAHAVAVAVQDGFERIAFVELAGAASADDVALAVGAAVGARIVLTARRLGDRLPPDLATRTADSLTARRTLLILDNCEHVVEAVSRLAADHLAAVPSLTVLTTSRVALLLPGESVFQPAPLPAATAAARLFRERAAAARPGTLLDAAIVERICEHLDGLPLALELAAARLRSMTLAELDQRLADRFAVLVGSDRTAPERHRTLFAVIDWSWQLLTPDRRRALRLLAVFPDGFAADAASSLLATDASGALTDLVDQSLLTFSEGVGGRGRYRMLETVREFGLRALDEAGETDAAHRALDRFALELCRGLAPGLTGGIDPDASRRAAVEEETLLAVLRTPAMGREPVVLAVFALLAEFWIYRGEFDRIPELAPVAVAAGVRRPADEHEREEALRALTLAAALATLTRSPGAVRALALLHQVRRTLPPGADGFWATLSAALFVRQSGEEALADLLTLRDTSTDPLVATFTSLIAGQLFENSGRIAEALIAATEARRRAERHGFTWFRLVASMSMAQLHSQRAEREEALRLARAAQQEIVALDVRADLGQLEWIIAINEVVLGPLDDAEQRFARLVTTETGATSRDRNDNRSVGLAGLADVASARGDRGGALRAWAVAADAADESTVPWRIVVNAAALAASAALVEPDADPAAVEARYRRLRGRVLAVSRFSWEQVDVPVFASGVVGVAAVLLMPGRSGEQRAAGAELVDLAVRLGARVDFPSLEAVPGVRAALDAHPEPAGRDEAVARVLALLRLPAVRI